MFPACPAEMLLTLLLKNERLPVMMGIVQVRPVMFTTCQFPFKYGQFVCWARPVSFSRQDVISIGLARSVTNKP